MTHREEGSQSMTTNHDELIVRRAGRLGHMLLNRPKALNSLSRGMVTAIAETLEAWRDDPDVQTVLISGSGDRGLCAGGDIVSVYRSMRESKMAEAEDFFRAEYAMNLAISEYPKPYVAFMDGVVLGGGVGVSGHGSHRIVTERTRMGMPETGIGFTPDVGGSWLLSHTPSEFGTHLALTGDHFTGADACALGLADHYAPSDRLEDLATALETTDPDEAIGAVTEPAPESELWAHRGWIEDCYGQDTAEQIMAALQDGGQHAGEDGTRQSSAAAAAETLRIKSPTSVKVTLASLRRARGLDSLAQALDTEFRLVTHLLRGNDFAEGIRAQLVDKDRNPRWSPATLEEVTEQRVAEHFQTPESGELGLDRAPGR